MLDMAKCFIGFRNEAETLRSKLSKHRYFRLFFPIQLWFLLSGSLKFSQEHAKQLEIKLNARDKARKKAEAKALAAKGLQSKLEATKEALEEAQNKAAAMKDRIDQINARETKLIERLDAQSEKFGGLILVDNYCITYVSFGSC